MRGPSTISTSVRSSSWRTGAAIVGRMIGYVMGRQLGYRLVLQYGKQVGLTEGRIKLAQYLFLRHGGKIIFVAQFVPVLRSFAGLLAGVNVMPWRNFLLANAVSSSVWAVGYGYAAYWAGREFEHSHRHVAIFLVIIAVIVIITVGIFVHDRRGRSCDARASKIALMTCFSAILCF